MTNEQHLMTNQQHQGRKAKAVQWSAKPLSRFVKHLRKITAA